MVKVKLTIGLMDVLLLAQVLEQDGQPSALDLASRINAAALRACRKAEQDDRVKGPSEAAP